MLLAVFTSSTMYASLHHASEDHWLKERCHADEGESHLHGWEFDHCDVCDLHLSSSHLSDPDLLDDIPPIAVKPYVLAVPQRYQGTLFFDIQGRAPPMV